MGQFSAFCAKDVQAVNLTDKADAVQRSLLSSFPDIVISTPARAWHAIEASFLSLDNLSHLVLDEADLLLSYGYSDDLGNIARSLPKSAQKILMSATLTPDVDTLKGMFCRNPALLDLEEREAEGEGATHYYVKYVVSGNLEAAWPLTHARCAEDEKFLLAYIIFKLQLIKGKCIIFVADVDRSYRLKLFFQQFGIRGCVLNSELPVNSRIHVVEEFNRNVYDIIIASDENEVLGDEEAPADGEPISEGASVAEKAAATGNSTLGDTGDRPKKRRRASKRDKEYGVSRGIDFHNVASIINFDLPTSAKSYSHRAGRTARAGQTGMVLSFVIPTSLYRKHVPTTVETAENDEKVLARVVKQQAKRGKEVKPYNFDMKQVEAFRYRMNDALRAVTKVAVREARTRELRQELLKSEALKRHFEENPTEMHHLVRHDGELRAARANPHLKNVPDYLLPSEGKRALTSEEIGFVPLRKVDQKGRRPKHAGKGGKGKGFRGGQRKVDPLRTFKAGRKGGKRK